MSSVIFSRLSSEIVDIRSKDVMKFEAEYKTVPDKNLFKTKFESLKENLSLVVSYIRNF